MNRLLEICCYNAQSAISAAKNGADRVELCENWFEGGTTPSYGTIKQTLKHISIPLHILIRPRGGDFLYSQIEYEVIKEDILKAKEMGVQGVVCGILSASGKIDRQRTKEIVQLASPLSFTFHRAFDMCQNLSEELKVLQDLAVDRVLTSGGQAHALQATETLAQLVNKSPQKPIIMPGGGVRASNIEQLIKETGALEYHSSAKIFKQSKMAYFPRTVSMSDVSVENEKRIVSVDTDAIKKMKKILLTKFP